MSIEDLIFACPNLARLNIEFKEGFIDTMPLDQLMYYTNNLKGVDADGYNTEYPGFTGKLTVSCPPLYTAEELEEFKTLIAQCYPFLEVTYVEGVNVLNFKEIYWHHTEPGYYGYNYQINASYPQTLGNFLSTSDYSKTYQSQGIPCTTEKAYVVSIQSANTTGMVVSIPSTFRGLPVIGIVPNVNSTDSYSGWYERPGINMEIYGDARLDKCTNTLPTLGKARGIFLPNSLLPGYRSIQIDQPDITEFVNGHMDAIEVRNLTADSKLRSLGDTSDVVEFICCYGKAGAPFFNNKIYCPKLRRLGSMYINSNSDSQDYGRLFRDLNWSKIEVMNGVVNSFKTWVFSNDSNIPISFSEIGKREMAQSIYLYDSDVYRTPFWKITGVLPNEITLNDFMYDGKLLLTSCVAPSIDTTGFGDDYKFYMSSSTTKQYYAIGPYSIVGGGTVTYADSINLIPNEEIIAKVKSGNYQKAHAMIWVDPSTDTITSFPNLESFDMSTIQYTASSYYPGKGLLDIKDGVKVINKYYDFNPTTDSRYRTNHSIGRLFSLFRNHRTMPDLDYSDFIGLHSTDMGYTDVGTMSLINSAITNQLTGKSEYLKLRCPGLRNYGKCFDSAQEANYEYYGLNLCLRAVFGTNVSSDPDAQEASAINLQNIINVLNTIYDIASLGCNTQTIKMYKSDLSALEKTEQGLAAIENATNKGWTIVGV